MGAVEDPGGGGMALITPLTRAPPYAVRQNGERPRSIGGVQEIELCNRAARVVIS